MTTEPIRIAMGRPKYTEGELQVFRKQKENLRKQRIKIAKDVVNSHMKYANEHEHM